jgi:membrane protease YdiL (CAAX protease family)
LPWYVAVIIGFPAVNLVAAWLLAPEFLKGLPSWDRLLYMLPLTLVTDTGPLGEEFGLRGFALPRLLRRQSPLASAVILGVIWWAWVGLGYHRSRRSGSRGGWRDAPRVFLTF